MQRPAFPPEVRGAFALSATGTIWNARRFALRIISGKIIFNSQFWKICGFSRIAFSRVGSWRGTVFAIFSGLALSVKACRLCQLSQRESLWRNHTLYNLTGNCTAMPRPLPLGEVARRSRDGEGEDAFRSAALSQKAALQMPFPSTTPPVKTAFGAARRPRQTRNLK